MFFTWQHWYSLYMYTPYQVYIYCTSITVRRYSILQHAQGLRLRSWPGYRCYSVFLCTLCTPCSYVWKCSAWFCYTEFKNHNYLTLFYRVATNKQKKTLLVSSGPYMNLRPTEWNLSWCSTPFRWQTDPALLPKGGRYCSFSPTLVQKLLIPVCHRTMQKKKKKFCTVKVTKLVDKPIGYLQLRSDPVIED